jgi:hypothetical protein
VPTSRQLLCAGGAHALILAIANTNVLHEQ